MTPQAYLESRGVTLPMAARWGVLLEASRIFFPVNDELGAQTGHAYCYPNNSPRWSVSDPDLRRRALYGVPQALGCMSPVVTLVESQTDTIVLAELGQCVVAAMCCLLTIEQAAIIARYWPRARIDFDDDPAGQSGAKQAAILLTAAGVAVET